MAKRHTEQHQTSSRRRRKPTKAQAHATKQFYLLIAMLTLILVFVIGIAVMVFGGSDNSDKTPSTENNLFAVKTVSVEGNTKYSEDAVVGESGVLIGQNIFAVKGAEIQKHLLETFPYFETVQVQTLNMKEVRITVTETDVVGVMYAHGYWIPIGENGRVLDKKEIDSDRPRNALYIKAASVKEDVAIGDVALEEYSASVLTTMLGAIERYDLNDIIEVDLRDMNDIRMNWRGQVEIYLGNETNLEHEIKVVSTVIPRLLEVRGQQVKGVLNLRSYSNDALENQAVFSPASSADTTTTATRKPAAGETTHTTTAPTTAGDEWYDDPYEDDTYYDDSYEDDSYYDDSDYDESSDYEEIYYEDEWYDDSYSDETEYEAEGYDESVEE